MLIFKLKVVAISKIFIIYSECAIDIGSGVCPGAAFALLAPKDRLLSVCQSVIGSKAKRCRMIDDRVCVWLKAIGGTVTWCSGSRFQVPEVRSAVSLALLWAHHHCALPTTPFQIFFFAWLGHKNDCHTRLSIWKIYCHGFCIFFDALRWRQLTAHFALWLFMIRRISYVDNSWLFRGIFMMEWDPLP